MKELKPTICKNLMVFCQAVPLHLAKAEAALSGSALGRLARQHDEGTRRPRVNLVGRAVTEALVVAGADKDGHIHLATRVAIVENLVAVGLHPIVVPERCCETVHRRRIKGGTVPEGSRTAPDFTQKGLHELGNGHAARNRMGIDDEVRDNARARLGHVFGVENHAHGALLTMSRTEFIAYLGNTVLTHPNLGKGIPLSVPVLVDPVHIAALIVAGRLAHVSARLGPRRHDLARRDTEGHDLANQNIVGRHIGVFGDEPVEPQLVVIRILHVLGLGRVRTTEALLFARRLILLLLVLVRAVKDAAEAAPVQGPPVNHVGILLVVPRIGHDGDNHIRPRRQLLGPVKLTHEGAHHGNFRVAEDVRHGVEPLLEIRGKEAHGLLGHGRLVGIAGTLVVIRKGDHRGNGAEGRTGVNLGVGPTGLGQRRPIVHGNVGPVRLARVQVFKEVLFGWSRPH